MIPPIAHFIWLTPDFPWLNVAALRSAERHGGFERVVLHHVHALPESRCAELEGIELRRLDPLALIQKLAGVVGDAKAAELQALYRGLDKPAAQSNLLRVAVLALEGGVYLDLDTITVQSLLPLCAEGGAFCGSERLAFPGAVVSLRRPLAYSKGVARSLVRAVLREVPGGFRWFRKIEGFYPSAANNAVLGAEPGHALCLDLLGRMLRLSRTQARRRYALGTHLLQTCLRETALPGVRVHPSAVFYPLGPEISQHWFRRTTAADPTQALTPETRVVHWYASLRTQRQQEQMDRATVQRLAPEQMLSALVDRYAFAR